jgi:glycopeptide antibiotics resistance protein
MDTSPIAIQQPITVKRPNPLVLFSTVGYLGVIAWLTMTPGNREAYLLSGRAIRLLQGLPIELTWSQWEFILNIALFVPLGLLLVLLFGRRFFWVAIVLAIAVSGSVEWAQQFVPLRVPDTRDIIANGLGGFLGMLIGLAIPRRRRA